MAHSIKDFTFYHTRQALLAERLEHIRLTMTGDNLDVRRLLSASGGPPSVERAAQLAACLAAAVDDLQKAYWLTSDWEHDDETESRLGDRPDWRELLDRHMDYEQEVSFDLTDAPTTLTEGQRKTLESLFFCVLWGCTCEELGRTSVRAVREVLRGTAAFTPGWVFEGRGERAGLTEEDLVLRELEDEVEVGPDRRWYVGSDVFSMMDALYEVLTGQPATTLADEEVLRRVRESSAGQEILSYPTLSRDVERTWGSDSLRLLTELGVQDWEALERYDRWQALRTALDACNDDALARLEGAWELYELFGMAGLSEGARAWQDLGADQRRESLRAALNVLLEEARSDEARAAAEELEQIDAWYEDELRTFHEGIRSWAQRVGGSDELFECYRAFRQGFFAYGLPEGAFPGFGSRPGFSTQAGRWFAEGFVGLADAALDTVLGEEGLSWSFDDEVFHRTYAYLGETAFQMESAIDYGRK